jgi:cephalosporin-C deacetylase-like acetyl esterase
LLRIPLYGSAAGFLLFLAATLTPAEQWTFTPFHKDGIYGIGERAGWTVTLPQGAAATGKYSYIIKTNNLATIKTGALDLSSGSATIETTLGEPAMLYVEVNGNGPAVHLGAAVAPSELKPSAPRPTDFDGFWDGKLKALGEIPINPVLTTTPADRAGVQLYTVTLDSLGSRAHGYLAKPSRGGKFPALVIFQYAGVYALQPETITKRAAEGWLAFDVDSHDLPPSQATGVSPNYFQIGNTDRESSYFLNMYLRDSRAIDYVASRPDWDGKTVVVMGTSMGGQQSLVTAGLNPKVTAVIVKEPSGADSNGDLHGRKAGYPNWPSDNPKVMETALYFDTVNFASRIKAPVLAAVGFIDTIAPPAGICTAMNQVRGPKEIIPMVESDHNNITPEKQGAYNTRSEEVLGIILKGGVFKPDAGPSDRN